jgi:glutamate-1-semialdehyde aminotransferase
MAVFDPRGGKPLVPHGGTFNANPVTMAAEVADYAALIRPTDYGLATCAFLHKALCAKNLIS